jgi:amino acid transporter
MVMTIIELSGLLIVIVAVAVMLGGGRGDASRVGQFPDGAVPALAILSGAIVAYYSFVGFETSANVAEEIRNASKVSPVSLFGALITAAIVYTLVGIASATALSPSVRRDDDDGRHIERPHLAIQPGPWFVEMRRRHPRVNIYSSAVIGLGGVLCSCRFT